MTRLASATGLGLAACLGLLAAVLLGAVPAGAENGTPTTTTTTSTVVTTTATTTTVGTTTAPGTTTAASATTPAPVAKPKPVAKPARKPVELPAPPREPAVALPKLITAGVSVGGTLVGGLTRTEAREIIEQRFARPFTIVVSKKTLQVTPAELGASANVPKALRTAANVHQQGFLVPLDISVSEARVQRLLDRISKEIDTAPQDARLVLKGLRPVIVDAKPGLQLDRKPAARAITLALRTQSRDEIVLPTEEKAPKVGDDAFGPIIVIQRGSNKLNYYVGERLKRTFAVATGRSEFPTPLGRFEVINMQRNPWWYPPSSDWAQDLSPVPPGPGNPLGTRWMGISSPAVGIHGTPDAASIGYSASHGCIRMLIPQVEWLFERVKMGTPVFIVPA